MTSAQNAHDRLIRAADMALRADDPDAVTIEAVAVAAGVSRATAFRQLGKHEDMIVAVGLLRANDYAHSCSAEMAAEATALGQIHAGFQFLVRELPTDPVMGALIALRTVADLAEGTRALVSKTFGPAIERGRLTGEVRVDVSAEQVARWVVEQLHLAMQDPDRSFKAVRDRLQLFLFPAITPVTVGSTAVAATKGHVDRVLAVLSDAVRGVGALRDELAP